MVAKKTTPKPLTPKSAAFKAPKENAAESRARMAKVIDGLKALYEDAKCSLDFKNPFELLCATILSAQCTDERVNMVTPALFKRFPDAKAMGKAPLKEVEELVKSTGFYKNKALSLVETGKLLTERHGGEVPRTMEELTALRGVGRKTANVVMGNAYGIPGLVVDTHVGRLTRRLGFTKKTDPVDVEHEMMELVPREDWTLFAHLLINHGRARCMARKPDCDHCEIAALCRKVID